MVWTGLGEGIEGILYTGGIASATDVRPLILTPPSGFVEEPATCGARSLRPNAARCSFS